MHKIYCKGKVVNLNNEADKLKSILVANKANEIEAAPIELLDESIVIDKTSAELPIERIGIVSQND